LEAWRLLSGSCVRHESARSPTFLFVACSSVLRLKSSILQ